MAAQDRKGIPLNDQTITRYLEVAPAGFPARRIAYEDRSVPDSPAPGIVWLPGFKSTMVSTKISALKDWAAHSQRSLVCFEYSGHGSSDGEFSDGTISQWLHECLAILRHVAKGDQILIGSSMGGWLVLLILRAIAQKTPLAKGLQSISAAILIAPAHDMTETLMWQRFDAAARRAVETDGVFMRPSRYGDGPYPLTRGLIEDGRNHLIAETPFVPPCPVHIIHGKNDPDVPWEHGRLLLELLDGGDVAFDTIEDGDHRLSRPQDIEHLIDVIEKI